MNKHIFSAFLPLFVLLLTLGACAETVYLDGTGQTAGAYTELAAAVSALGEDGGSVILTGDTAVSGALTLPVSGDLTLTAQNGAALTLCADMTFAAGEGGSVTLDLPVIASGAVRVFGGFCSFTFTEDFTSIGDFSFFGGVDAALCAENADAIAKQPYTVTVGGGSFTYFAAGNARTDITDTVGSIPAGVQVTVSGGRFTDSFSISGAALLSGDAALTVTGGSFACPIFAQGALGAVGTLASLGSEAVTASRELYALDGDTTLTISGGTFSGGIIGAYETQVAYTQVMRGDFTLTVDGGSFTVPTVLDATQVKAYPGSDKKASVTYDPAEYPFTAVRFDRVNGEAQTCTEPLRIAFIGDSITEGYNLDRLTKSYPAVFSALAADAGREVVVSNFAASGSGMLPSTKYYYPATLGYRLSLTEADADIYVLAQGTNDCAAGTANGTFATYTEDYGAYARALGALPDTQTVYLTSAIFYSPSALKVACFRLTDSVRASQRRLAQTLMAEAPGKYGWIDLYGLTLPAAANGGFLSGDGLHPSAAGYRVMGQAMYDALFNGVTEPADYRRTEIYVSAAGTPFADGSAAHPTSRLDVAFEMLPLDAEATVHIVGEYVCDVDLPLSHAPAKLTFVGESGGKLTFGGTSVFLAGETVFDNLTLASTGDASIYCNWQDLALTDTVTLTGKWSVYAGCPAYSEGAAQAQHDTESTVSSDADQTLSLNASGALSLLSLGNRRMAAGSVIGTYGGSLTCTVGDRLPVQTVYGVGQNYLTGSVSVTYPTGAVYTEHAHIGSLSGVTYSAAGNTGSVTPSVIPLAVSAGNTVFLASGGTGDGSSAESPVGTLEAAYAALGADGGTIVLTNDFPVNNASAAAFPAHTAKVRLTCVYGGTDYRTSGAQLRLTGTAFVSFNGPTELDGLTVKLDKSSAGIAANNHPLRIGYDVTVSAPGNAYALYLLGGQNNTSIPALGDGQTNTVEVYSGKYLMAGAFSRMSALSHTGKVFFTLGGTADVRDFYFGALSTGAKGGSCDLLMRENARVTNMYLSGNTVGMNGSITLTVTDYAAVGTFKNSAKTYFPSGTRTLRLGDGEGYALPAGYADHFDSVGPIPTEEEDGTVRFVAAGGTGDGRTFATALGDLAAAYAALPGGGTVVLCGAYTVDNSANVLLPSHDGTVLLTGKYGGTDYAGNLHLAGTSFLKFNGAAELDDLTVTLEKADAGLCANFHPLRIGYNLTVKELKASAGHGLYLVGGQNNDTSIPAFTGENTLEICSGKFASMSLFSRTTAVSNTGTVHLKLGGSADVRDLCLGTIGANSAGGTTDAVLSENAGVINLYLSGNTATSRMNGDVSLTVLGDGVKITTVKNFDPALFDGIRSLTVTGKPSLPQDFAAYFDTADLPVSAFSAALTLPEELAGQTPAWILCDGKAVTGTVTGGVLQTEAAPETSLLVLTYPAGGGWRRLVYTVSDGTALLQSDTLTDDRVLYIAGGGEGDGLSPDAPLGSIPAAYARMPEGDCTFVICGKLEMVKHFAAEHAGKLSVTSVFDGIDYRTQGAQLYYPVSTTWKLGGETKFENITLHFDKNGLIAAMFHPVTFGQGISILYDPVADDTAGLYLVGGDNQGAVGSGVFDEDTHITLESGSFSRVFGFSRYSGARDHTGTAYIDISGDTYVRYLLAGATGNSATAKEARITLRDDAIIEDLYTCGAEKTNPMYGECRIDLTQIGNGTIYEFDGVGVYARQGVRKIVYDPRTVPDGILHFADLALFDSLLTVCEDSGEHGFGTPYTDPFDPSVTIRTCAVCGYTEVCGDPLSPVGENVIFVADGGFGDGRNPSAPCGSYEEALRALGDDGGTVVLCGRLTVSPNLSYKQGGGPDFFQEPAHTGMITVTSVFGGRDYRKSGAAFVFDGDIDYRLSGPLTFTSVVFDAVNGTAENTVAARYFPLTFGKDCRMNKTFKADGYKLNLAGGYKYFRYSDFADVEIADEWLQILNHVTSVSAIGLPDEGALYPQPSFVLRKEAADAFNAMFRDMEALGFKLPTITNSTQTYEYKYDFLANFLGNTRTNHPDWDYERAYIYVTKSCGEPGRTEHHLGVAVDMYDTSLPYDSPNHHYNETAECQWIMENGWKYGIILRYPNNEYCRNVSGFINEAWHFRYVGLEHAAAMRDEPTGMIEHYVARRIGLFDRDSDVTLESGDFYKVSAGSIECDEVTFTGENHLRLGAAVHAADLSGVSEVSGDVNGDGRVNLLDVVRVLRRLTDDTLPLDALAADLDGNGSVELADALALLKNILNSDF